MGLVVYAGKSGTVIDGYIPRHTALQHYKITPTVFDRAVRRGTIKKIVVERDRKEGSANNAITLRYCREDVEAVAGRLMYRKGLKKAKVKKERAARRASPVPIPRDKPNTMWCAACGCIETLVVDSRRGHGYVIRRRECVTCKERFSTKEIRVQIKYKKQTPTKDQAK